MGQLLECARPDLRAVAWLQAEERGIHIGRLRESVIRTLLPVSVAESPSGHARITEPPQGRPGAGFHGREGRLIPGPPDRPL